MTSSRPYLLRALNEWIVDNDLTPYIVCDATMEEVVVPQQFVENGKIVLNINPSAVRNLNVNNEALSFSARFAGSAMDVFLPINAVLAIYAKENGQGMVFVDDGAPPPTPPSEPEPPKTGGKPNLKLVK